MTRVGSQRHDKKKSLHSIRNVQFSAVETTSLSNQLIHFFKYKNKAVILKFNKPELFYCSVKPFCRNLPTTVIDRLCCSRKISDFLLASLCASLFAAVHNVTK